MNRAIAIGLLLLSILSAPSLSGAMSPGRGAERQRIMLEVGPRVVRCTVGPVGDTARLRAMLGQGASITVRWVFSIARVREFWFDEDAGEVEVTRVVKSDLISRRWVLLDAASGVQIETMDLDRAVGFLTRLERFPLIDRALLERGADYEVRLKLHMHEGEGALAWWQRWVDFGKTVAVGRFMLPAGL